MKENVKMTKTVMGQRQSMKKNFKEIYKLFYSILKQLRREKEYRMVNINIKKW